MAKRLAIEFIGYACATCTLLPHALMARPVTCGSCYVESGWRRRCVFLCLLQRRYIEYPVAILVVRTYALHDGSKSVLAALCSMLSAVVAYQLWVDIKKILRAYVVLLCGIALLCIMIALPFLNGVSGPCLPMPFPGQAHILGRPSISRAVRVELTRHRIFSGASTLRHPHYDYDRRKNRRHTSPERTFQPSHPTISQGRLDLLRLDLVCEPCMSTSRSIPHPQLTLLLDQWHILLPTSKRDFGDHDTAEHHAQSFTCMSFGM